MKARPVEGQGGRPLPVGGTWAPAGASEAGAAGRWQVRRFSGSAASLFARALATRPTVALLHVDAPALILGSTQPEVPEAGVPVVRRRTGGGAVLLDPAAVVWIDVVVPAGDRLWSDDVGRAFLWLGDVWAAALAAVGVAGAVRHPGPLVRRAWSDRVCFAGLGPGEVTVGGRKVVGMSQRRTRDAVLFQCAALLAWDYEGIARLVGAPATALAEVAAGIRVGREELEGAFLDAVATV